MGLPSGATWVKMLSIEPTPAMLKAAKKQGEAQEAPNGCKILVFKDVAYLIDAEGRTNPACWRTKVVGVNLGTGAQPMVRSVQGRMGRVVGKEDFMLNAIVAHSGAAVTSLPTGHVQVLGEEGAVDVAMELIDDLADGDGAKAKETMAEHLTVAEPWVGFLEVPCPEEWAGAVIGKGGAGLKAIASESGALINYVSPEEAAGDGDGGGGGKKDEGGADASADPGKGDASVAAAAGAEGGEAAPAEAGGFFRITSKFENQGRLAAKRIEERLSLVQRLDTHAFVMVPRGSVGRLIGKAGANIKLLQRNSGASRISFEKEPSGKATTQSCGIIAPDFEAAVEAGKVILEAVALPGPEFQAALKARLENYPAQVHALPLLIWQVEAYSLPLLIWQVEAYSPSRS